jgi:hypothetical protein
MKAMAKTAERRQNLDKQLNVPYYSQFDERFGLTPEWQQRACGILAVKMVVDFWQGSEAPEVPLQELLNEANVVGGRNSFGDWLHSTLVMVARHRGYKAWRRGWMLSEDGRTRFEAEGADDTTLYQVDKQQREEAYHSLVQALEKGSPVLVSVAKNFAEVEKPHIIVLTGYRLSPDGQIQGYYYNDPSGQYGVERKNLFCNLDRFQQYWRFQGIFITPLDFEL